MLKLLIADDLEVSRKCLAMFLTRHGYHVLEAADGDEALRLTREERPDIAIVDLLMPEMDGFEFVREVRKDPSIADTPVIFLSANFPADNVKPIARSLGVRHTLQKSYIQAPVLEAIRETIQNHDSSEVAISDQEFQCQHLQLISEKLAEEFSGLASTMGELIESTCLAASTEPNETFQIVIDQGRQFANEMIPCS